MKVDVFDFELPPQLVAERPAHPRESARLLEVGPQLNHWLIEDLPSLLNKGDVLVFNNTRVIPAQLKAMRGNAAVDITLHQKKAPLLWHCFIKGAKKISKGDRLVIADHFTAIVMEKNEGEIFLQFECAVNEFDALLAQHGTMPIPPYIAKNRAADEQDRHDYQTIFAEREGAVAAPTAGLHFTPGLMKSLEEKGITPAFITLHVGAGTFLPVKVEDTADHKMHSEWFEIGNKAANIINHAREKGGRIVAVGTTSLRALESVADDNGHITPFSRDTSIFITPGYRFKVVDMLFTNFHLPRSTLFMLVSAFAGLEQMKEAYSQAIANKYRFYSYGDASLLHKKP